MTTPPHRLAERLEPFVGTIKLVNADNQLVAHISYTDALAQIALKRVEGVGTSSGRIKCLRELREAPLDIVTYPTAAAAAEQEEEESRGMRSGSSYSGVYLQPICNAAGDQIGRCWAFLCMRKKEGKELSQLAGALA